MEARTTGRNWVVAVQREGDDWPDVQLGGEFMRPQQLVVTVEQEGNGPLKVGGARAVGAKVCRGGRASAMAQLRIAWPGGADLVSAPSWVSAVAQAALASVAREAPVVAAGPVGRQT
jgi:hypothetical protein